MNPAFAAIKERGRFMQHFQLYPLLGIKSGDHLPREGFSKEIGGVAITVLPAAGKGRRSSHRVMVHCTCGRKIPFGRMGQHLRWKEHGQ